MLVGDGWRRWLMGEQSCLVIGGGGGWWGGSVGCRWVAAVG